MAPTATQQDFEVLGNCLVNYPADHGIIVASLAQSTKNDSDTHVLARLINRESRALADREHAALEARGYVIQGNTMNADQQGALKTHNDARAAKKVPPLVWNTQLQADAQAYSDHMAQSGVFCHSAAASRPNKGENLYYRSINNTNTPLTDAVTMWLKEVSFYHGETIPNGAFTSYGHYTQCMWNTSLMVGMAVTQSTSGALYVTARYDTAGNWYGLTPF